MSECVCVCVCVRAAREHVTAAYVRSSKSVERELPLLTLSPQLIDIDQYARGLFHILTCIDSVWRAYKKCLHVTGFDPPPPAPKCVGVGGGEGE